MGTLRGELKTELTLREKQVADLVVDGRSNRDVARLLKISEETVKAHLNHVFNKLGCDSRMQLQGLLTRPDDRKRVQDLRLEKIRLTHRLAAIEEALALLGEDDETKKPAIDFTPRAGDVAGVRTN
jgi:DNA-binding CsgD family transcriptional regulator